ncbi:hypothetical protein ZHAS_00020724 [Anopheles sinensis]|uniref:Uncharacterized protein n=1 Tax=Anopheles sinensis TaxID=74873 RepID=A0A084WQI7_ANOSI|nr:hypothetical protein ZHAS_00020724 [Anopheles sinensis]
MHKRVKQSPSGEDVVIAADKNETNVTASTDDSGCLNAVSGSRLPALNPAATLGGSVASCCDAPLCNNSRKCIVRQKSQKIVLAPSSGENHVYHIYGEFGAEAKETGNGF